MHPPCLGGDPRKPAAGALELSTLTERIVDGLAEPELRTATVPAADPISVPPRAVALLSAPAATP